MSKVLRGLKRRNPITRRSRQANDPVTAAYLAAAVRLIQRHLGPGASGCRAMRTTRIPSSGRCWVSCPSGPWRPKSPQSSAVSPCGPGLHDAGTVAAPSDFVADVLRFGLWASHYPASHQYEAADARDEVIGGPDPVRGVHRMCYWDMNKLLATPMFRLGLVAAAEAEGDPVIAEAMSERHQENDPLWKRFYEEFLQSRGLRMRAGITLDDCVIVLAAVADGLALRALADPAAPVIDHARGAACSGRPSWP